MQRIPVGHRIREQRQRLGLSQKTLARSLSISTAYLSLIENNRRMIAGALLKRAAEALDLDLDHLSGTRDARLADQLGEVTRDLGLEKLIGTPAVDLASRRPDWARAFIDLHRALQEATDTAMTLADRMNRDPALMSISHQTLTDITSIRSSAEILAQYPTLDPDDQKRFVDIIVAASDGLSASARAMIDMLARSDDTLTSASPIREVEDFIIDHGNFFAGIEDEAEALTRDMPEHGLGLNAALAARLDSRHQITITRANGAGASADLPGDRQDRIELPAGAPEETIRFLLARELALRDLAEPIEAVLRGTDFSTEAAGARARTALARYGAGAILFPYGRFHGAAEDSRYDLDHLQARFGASFEQVAHRLVTLRRPGAEGIPFAFLRSDPAGNSSKRFSLPGIPMPQYGGACPLWAIYGALAQPGQLLTQLAEMPDGSRYMFLARQVEKGRASSRDQRTRFAVMIACEAHFAPRIVHADPFLPGQDSLVSAVGWECRSCRRMGCAQRAFPPILPPAQEEALNDDGSVRHFK